jgi:broad specificity phosphatase PhoE
MRALLVRHGMCAAVGHTLAGRAPGMSLDDVGRRQATALAHDLADAGAAAIYTSPLERAMETACAIGARAGVTVTPLQALIEMDVGEWTGRTLTELDADAGDAWRRHNVFRSASRAPRGELQLEVQARAVAALLDLLQRHASDTVIAVTHAEVIRAVLGHWLGVPIDLQRRIDVAPASVTTIELEPWDARVTSVGVLSPAIRACVAISSV